MLLWFGFKSFNYGLAEALYSLSGLVLTKSSFFFPPVELLYVDNLCGSRHI